MTKTKATMVLAFAISLAAPGIAAAAPGAEGAIGLGVEQQISGTGGISMNYNTEKFHVGGFFQLNDPPEGNNTVVGFGGRFFYHVHNKSATADFSIGGSIGILSLPDDADPDDDRSTQLFIEPSFQVRAFIVPNVALSFTGGIVIGAASAGGVVLDGQLTATGGIHYYFF